MAVCPEAAQTPSWSQGNFIRSCGDAGTEWPWGAVAPIGHALAPITTAGASAYLL